MSDSVSDFFEEHEFGDNTLDGEDLFAIFETLDSVTQFPPVTPSNEVVVISKDGGEETTRLVSQKSTSSSAILESETELETSPKNKRQKTGIASSEEINPDGQQRMSHITVERNRRKQMNEHLSVLRSLMPCFYVKRGDQASIIGGVVNYINELQQVLQALEAKKQRKVYSEVLSPRIASSPRPSPLSPRKPPLSPRLNLPISPRTPQPGSPYRPRLQQQGYLSPTVASSLEPSPTTSSSSSINDNINELVANSKSAIADVEVKFSGPNLLLKTVSPRIPGQATKIISALEELSLEILHVNVSTVDETMLNSFTIKIGIECQLSAEELAQQIQQTFC
ncbi:transcription factor SPEECHLESS [Ricinus communis]|uniref:DNA binding protein, putative n=1 Tax=Ricinus communis TaxID=3988 RepID=B9RIM0_RICCO|nr:transcription factor SPEECHLESS [Ricinus communis]EEF48992.1 DNA binding protein, putative [Ricinus communis]|eukprot:XP_002513589.1 transcription factor SPEECHLESS [Ricinus communis]